MLLKVAACTVSGTTALPFATATQVVVPDTLLEEQPVGYVIEMPVVVPTTLYVTLNNRPVVGGVVDVLAAMITSTMPGLD